ncbi:hypothetical protein [Neptunomonas japonica]|uniref:hypothetical protein n=1 Tax=Neptunomonas japonica TaxID=417574 RepID=UPI0004183537|nr:hypothetical protein [Neptunomonas japonica]
MSTVNEYSMTEQEVVARLAKWCGTSKMPDNRSRMIKLLHTNKPAPEVFAEFCQLSGMTRGESELVLTALADNLSALRRKKVVGS